MIRVYDTRSSNCPMPWAVYVDTCWLAEMYASNPTQRGIDARDYVRRIAAQDGVIVVSHKALEELEHVIRKGLNRSTSLPPNVGRPALAKQEYDRIVGLLRGNPSVEILGPSTSNDYYELRDKVKTAFPQLASYDLSHLVIAADNGINCIATLDTDFLCAKYINVLTCDQAVLKGAGNSLSTTDPLISFNDFSSHIGNG